MNDPRTGTQEEPGLTDELVGDELGDLTDDRDPGDGEPGEPDGPEGGGEVERLREQNRQLLRMKSNAEDLRERNRDLEEALRQRGEEPDAEDRDVDEIRAAMAEIAEEHPAVAKVVGKVMGYYGGVIARQEETIGDLRDRVTSASRIPAADQKAVDRMMRSGLFGSREVAHLALLGARGKVTEKETRRTGSSGDREPARPTAERREERRPTAVHRRGVPPGERADKGVVTLAEHQRRLEADDVDYARRWRDGKVKVLRPGERS